MQVAAPWRIWASTRLIPHAFCSAIPGPKASMPGSLLTTLNYDVDDSGTIVINWENGATSIVESGWWWPHADGPESCTQVYGTEAFGQIFPTRLEIPDRATETIDVIDAGYPHPRDEHCPQIMYDVQMAYFINCVRNDKTPNPGAVEGMVNMRIVDAALKSSRTGQAVTL